MTDIEPVFKGRSGPYDKGLRVQVVAVGRPMTYTGRDSQVKQVLAAAISDSKDVIKVSCYDPSKFRFFQVSVDTFDSVKEIFLPPVLFMPNVV